MSTTAAQILGHPPGVNFRPDDDELVEFFLLPRLRREPSWFPGAVIIDDDSAANTLPWNLMKRHGLADDDEAYFFVQTNDAVARQGRSCPGDGMWVSQRLQPGSSCTGGGETIKWRKTHLNLHMGGKKGSTGWVMHEYTLTEPPCPSLRICHVTFTGHGKCRKRVPDDEESDCLAAGEPAASNKRPRVAAAAATSAPAMFQQEQYSSPGPIEQGISAMADQQQMVTTMPLLDDCQAASSSSATCASGSTTMTAADQESGEEPAQAIDEEALEWFMLHGKDLLDDGEPTAEQQHDGLDQQDDEQFWRQALVVVVEQQYDGLDQQDDDQLFWRSIGVDTENIVF